MKLGSISRGFAVVSLIVSLITAACGGSSTTPSTTVKHIAIYKLIDIDLITAMVTAFKTGVTEGGLAASAVEFKEYSAQGQSDLIPTVARTVVQDNPDLIFVVGTPAVIAVAKLTTKIPIIFGAMGDPVGAGLADSLAHPGRNATGTTDWIPPSASLDVVRTVLTGTPRIGTIYDPSNQNGAVFHDALKVASASAKLAFVDTSVSNSGEVANAARSLVGRADAIVVGPDAAVVEANSAIASVALKNKIAYIAATAAKPVPGLLMSLGVDYNTLATISGKDAAQVLKGTKPGEIAVQGMPTFSVTYSKSTLAALGLTLPASLASSAKATD